MADRLVVTDTVGEEHPANVSVLRAAVSRAVAALVEAPMIEAGQVTRSDGEVVASTWVRYVNGANFEVVRHEIQGAFASTAPFGGGAAPEPGPTPSWASDEEVAVRLEVAADGQLYASTGGNGSEWQPADPFPPAPYPWSIDLGRMQDGSYVDAAQAGDAVVQDAVDGGLIWTLRDHATPSGAIQRWAVSPDGVLRGYTLRHPGAGTPRTYEYRFQPRDATVPISAPDPGTPAELAGFGVWEDLPLPASLDVQHTVGAVPAPQPSSPAAAPAPSPIPWDRPQFLTNGKIDTSGFNAHLTTQPETATDPVAVALLLLGLERDDTETVVTTTDGRATVTLTRDTSDHDDSVASQQFEVVLQSDASERWSAQEASWGQACQSGRGHSAYTSEPCL